MTTDFATTPHPNVFYTIHLSLLQIWVKSVSDFLSYPQSKCKIFLTPSHFIMFLWSNQRKITNCLKWNEIAYPLSFRRRWDCLTHAVAPKAEGLKQHETVLRHPKSEDLINHMILFQFHNSRGTVLRGCRQFYKNINCQYAPKKQPPKENLCQWKTDSIQCCSAKPQNCMKLLSSGNKIAMEAMIMTHYIFYKIFPV